MDFFGSRRAVLGFAVNLTNLKGMTPTEMSKDFPQNTGMLVEEFFTPDSVRDGTMPAESSSELFTE